METVPGTRGSWVELGFADAPWPSVHCIAWLSFSSGSATGGKADSPRPSLWGTKPQEQRGSGQLPLCPGSREKAAGEDGIVCNGIQWSTRLTTIDRRGKYQEDISVRVATLNY